MPHPGRPQPLLEAFPPYYSPSPPQQDPWALGGDREEGRTSPGLLKLAASRARETLGQSEGTAVPTASLGWVIRSQSSHTVGRWVLPSEPWQAGTDLCSFWQQEDFQVCNSWCQVGFSSLLEHTPLLGKKHDWALGSLKLLLF